MNKIFLSALLTVMSVSPALAQSVAGDWTGRLKVSPQNSLKLVFHISDKPSVSIDSPDQNAYGIEGEVAFLSSDSVNFNVPALMMNYSGCLKDGKLSGTFMQRGMKLPLILESGIEKVNRPQTPVPPFPYSTEEVVVSYKGNSLAGTLTVPYGKSESMPVVVMVTGSGPQNRDEEVFNHRPFAVIADYLARNGVASLRYDDRGFGESTGDASSATTADFAEDAGAVVDWLKKNRNFKKVGLLGHSEGGAISYMLGAKPGKLDFIVSIAGPAVRGDSILLYQNMHNLQKAGIAGSVADDFEKALGKAFRIKIDNPDSVLTDAMLSDIYPSWNDSMITRHLADGIRGLFKGPSNPWLQYFITHSSAEDLKTLSIPALLIYGGKDRQVPASLNIPAAQALAVGATVREYPGLNHLMQNAVTGDTEEYNEIEETVSPQVLEDIASFINSL